MRKHWISGRTSAWLRILFLAAAGLLVLAEGGRAAPPSSFDHMTTGFVLNGAHRQVRCEQCHLRGVFRGTPRRCGSCHASNSQVAAGPSVTHIRTTNQCEACHVELSWQSITRVDHSEVIGSCFICHDDRLAQGRPAGHIISSRVCDDCHTTMGWQIVSMDHTQITTPCQRCHVTPIRHAPVTPTCEVCHTTRGWNPVLRMDHALVTGSCVTCHSSAAGGTGKPPTHIPSTNECDACHLDSNWTTIRVDHNAVVGTCNRCHVTTAGHVSVTPSCDDCHTSAAWVPVARVDHAAVLGACVACHDTIKARGKEPTHISSTNDCDACHTTVLWTTVRMDHGATTVTRCTQCHNGTPPGVGIPVGHMQTTGECDLCHATTAWIPTNFDHAAATGTCISCHDNVTATGKTQNHPNTNNQCDACHRTGLGWANPRMDHTQTTVTRCSQCHNGTPPGVGKPGGHVSTTSECDFCHSTTAWIPTTFDHGAATGTCISCHDNVTAAGKPGNHPSTSDRCDACHRQGAGWANPQMDHTQTTVPTCSQCHNGTPPGVGKPGGHVSTRSECDFCHTTTGWIPTHFDHGAVTGSCISCHDNVTTMGKPQNHISTSNLCDACHRAGAGWTGAQMDHTQTTVTRCSQCHNGTPPGVGKPGGHMQTTSECDACHATTAWVPTSFSHDAAAGACSSCHNGQTAMGPPNGHFSTTQQCDVCHQTGTGGWRTMNFRHSGNYPDHGRLTCRDCHKTNNEIIPWPSPAYQPDCAGCHANDYRSNPHKGASVSSLRNCAGTCHKSSPEHRPTRNSW